MLVGWGWKEKVPFVRNYCQDLNTDEFQPRADALE